MTIFKFSMDFLKKNPKFKIGLKSILESNNSFSDPPVDSLIQLMSNYTIEGGSSDENILEILFTQRVANHGDLHSGEVCYPGGKVDKGESDLEGALREVREEVGLEITSDNSVYLGKLPINYYAYLKRGRRYFVSQNFALCLSNLDSTYDELQSPLSSLNLTLSPQEIKEAWWLPYDYFIQPQSLKKLIKIQSNLPNYSVLSFGTNPSFEQRLPTELKSRLEKAEFKFSLYIMRLSPKKILWGMSLVLTGCMVELGINPQMSYRVKRNSEIFALRSRAYRASSGIEDLDLASEYGMSCRLETLRMTRYLHGSLSNTKL